MGCELICVRSLNVRVYWLRLISVLSCDLFLRVNQGVQVLSFGNVFPANRVFLLVDCIEICGGLVEKGAVFGDAHALLLNGGCGGFLNGGSRGCMLLFFFWLYGLLFLDRRRGLNFCIFLHWRFFDCRLLLNSRIIKISPRTCHFPLRLRLLLFLLWQFLIRTFIIIHTLNGRRFSQNGCRLLLIRQLHYWLWFFLLHLLIILPSLLLRGDLRLHLHRFLFFLEFWGRLLLQLWLRLGFLVILGCKVLLGSLVGRASRLDDLLGLLCFGL